METLLYTIKPSNLPSSTPLYQPVVENTHNQDVEKVSAVLAQSLGYEKMVVLHVLQNLASSLPQMLAAGTVDLGFLTLAVGMSGTVLDANTQYNATNAPLSLRVALKKKSTIIEAIRSLISLQKNPYIPKIPQFTGTIASRYGVEGFVPISSSYAITGNYIGLTGKELYAYTSIDVEWSQGDGASFLFDDIITGTNTRISVVNPYEISKAYNEKAFIKFLLWNNTSADGVYSPTYRLVYGGVELIPVTADPDLVYKADDKMSTFKFSIDNDGDLAVQWLSAAIDVTTFGTAVKIIDEQVELVLEDTLGGTPDTCKVWIGTGAIEKYTAMANLSEGRQVEVVGYRE